MKPKAGLPPHTSTVLDVPLAVSTRVVVGTDTRGHATHVARAETVLFSAGVSHTWLTTMFPTLPLAGGVLSPRYWWSQGMVVGAKESEGEARHARGWRLRLCVRTGCGSDAESHERA